MPAHFQRETRPRRLPLDRGFLHATGDTLQGPRATDGFEVVACAGEEIGVALLDLRVRAESGDALPRLLTLARRGFEERAPLHLLTMSLVRELSNLVSGELGVSLLRCSAAAGQIEVSSAGMPPIACVAPGGEVRVHAGTDAPLTFATASAPPIDVVPLLWGSTWALTTDGCTGGSRHPEQVRRLATDLGLRERGLELSRSAPEVVYDLLSHRSAESSRFTRDDATLVLFGADSSGRFRSGIR